ncbi:hypothetical protein ACFZBU_41990 [Embleya sp. NPDC008237]|uniref:hypothetical protein n=1 Tax=Embleya sp. NPDC008237 TaxID=3363978 RepID=UPI0036F08838
MTPAEAEAITGLQHVAGAQGIQLPRAVTTLLGTSLLWSGGTPTHNSLTPGYPPVEYSFSTWQPEEFRMAAQLFATVSAPERLVRTVDLTCDLADRSPWAGSLRRVACAPLPSGPKRFGAFFGMTAAVEGLTGLETYLEAVEENELLTPLLPGPLRQALKPSLGPAFTGIGIRRGTVRRRAYLAVTRDLETPTLLRALGACGPSGHLTDVLRSLGDVTKGRRVLPARTVMVTSADDDSTWSVELHAKSYGWDLGSLPGRLPRLRNAAFRRWTSAIGGRRALATVISIRFSQEYGPGIAVYAVPAWARQPTSPASRPMACPPSSTESLRTLPVADPDVMWRARNPAT